MRDNDWGTSDYPLVAGHEGVGRVTHVGSLVTTHSIGDVVALTWIRDSCGNCQCCAIGRENICETGYQGLFLGPHSGPWGSDPKGYHAHGGCFAKIQRIEAKFAIPVPQGLPMEMACPLVCGGGTVWEPIREHAFVGARVGVVGLGGLGTAAVKLARLVGCVVTVVSRSSGKEEAARRAGASEFWTVDANGQVEDGKGGLDVVLDTRPTNADLRECLKWVKNGGKVVRVGIPGATDMKFEGDWIPLIFQQKSVVGTIVTGTRRMSEMFEVVKCNVETMRDDEEWKTEKVAMSEVNVVMDKLLKGENKGYRYLLQW